MANDRIRFGPSGNSESFYAQGHKHSVEMPQWLHELGLDAYEYSFGRGVKLSEAKAAEIGAEAKKYNIAISVHAPYYINLASENEETRLKSRQYVYESAKAAKALGASRIVLHAGACGAGDRREALRVAMGELESILQGLEEQNLAAAILCPETMGKPKQLGTLDEVLELCSLGNGMLPTVDFGHINALEQGSLKAEDDYRRIIDAIDRRLGSHAAASFHIHFSHIEYGKSGEVRHLTFEDEAYGPDFRPLANVLRERNMTPVVICESRDVMAEDALKMKQMVESAHG